MFGFPTQIKSSQFSKVPVIVGEICHHPINAKLKKSDSSLSKFHDNVDELHIPFAAKYTPLVTERYSCIVYVPAGTPVNVMGDIVTRSLFSSI